ncbi:MAG TPA: hypothetical protein VF066_03610 [Thermoleophilaceae bacterium]
MAQERLGIGRACPRCGARSDTLGTICPVCKKPYASDGLLEVLNRPFASPLVVLLGLVFVVVWIWLIVTHLVAGILVAAAAFGLLVAAIGVTNAMTERGR